MPDAGFTPETQPSPEAEDVQSPPGHGRRSPLAVLAVLGAFVALGALWFALFGAPQSVGPEISPVPAGTPTPPASASATSAAPITLDDAKSVLSQLDYEQSGDASTTAYNGTLTHVLAAVDVLTFAQNTLEATPAILWRDPATGESRSLTAAEKTAAVADSTAAYLKRISTVGDSTALSDVMGMRLFPPGTNDRLLPDSQLEVIGQGLAPLGLLFGAQNASSDWSWRVEDVRITGPRSAEVLYSAKTKPGATWRFTDPGARYTKHLTFVRSDGGRWMLAGWTNYAQVAEKFWGNVQPPGAATLDKWWGAL